MKKILVLSFLALVFAGCIPNLLPDDNRVTIGPALDSGGKPIAGAFQLERVKDFSDPKQWATRINSSQEITQFAPQDGCVRVKTELGGEKKALKCSAPIVVVWTLGQIDKGLVKP